MSAPSVAIVHDFLTIKGGSERVALALTSAFPDAPLYTSLYKPDGTFAEFADVDVRTGPLNRVPRFRNDHRLALPFLSPSFRATRIDADVVICSSAGFSHHVRTTGAKVVYCHTPARWLYDADRYVNGWSGLVGVGAAVMRPALAPLDRVAMAEASLIIANSPDIAAEVERIYDREPIVISPCSSLSLDGPVEPIANLEPGFILCPSRTLGYKRLDVLVDAARMLPELQFLHIGDGPHRSSLADAPRNVRSVGSVDDARLRWAYRNARAVAITCAEDFGLVPMEAHAHGLTSVVPRARGLIGQRALAESGIFYDYGRAEALAKALVETEAPRSRALHPDRLGVDEFISAIATHAAAL
ncbi:MAG: glycosyltransferase [Actinomycetota bacterium]